MLQSLRGELTDSPPLKKELWFATLSSSSSSVWPSGGKYKTRSFCWWTFASSPPSVTFHCKQVNQMIVTNEWRMHTISCSGSVSFSDVMSVLWIRNLSLHLAAVGGSSFLGCNITEGQSTGSSDGKRHTLTYQQHQHFRLVLFSLSLAARNRAILLSDYRRCQ